MRFTLVFLILLISFSFLHLPLPASQESENEVNFIEGRTLPETNEKNKEDDDKDPKKPEPKKKPSPHTFTGSVTFISDYRSRGISQTMCRPAIQGEMKYVHESGFYFKSWASNVDGTTHFINNSSMEWDLYVGFEKPLLQTSVKYNAGFLYYYYPGGKALTRKEDPYDTIEYYIGASYKGLEIKISQTITDFFAVNSVSPPFNWEKNRFACPNGHSFGSSYIEANYQHSLYAKLKASLHVGYQTVTNYSELDYLDWQAAVTYEFEGFELSLFYIDTNAKHAYYDVPDNAFKPKIRKLGGATLVAGISRNF